MEFWSKGLGRRSLVLELGSEKVEADAQRVALSGNVAAPVTWNYIMYLEPRDWTRFFELALRGEMATYLLCRRRATALLRLTAFLGRFAVLYLLALVRVWLRLAHEPAGVSVAPDPTAQSQIDPAALRGLDARGGKATRRPRPRQRPAGAGTPPTNTARPL
jgi:hypothetical protein